MSEDMNRTGSQQETPAGPDAGQAAAGQGPVEPDAPQQPAQPCAQQPQQSAQPWAQQPGQPYGQQPAQPAQPYGQQPVQPGQPYGQVPGQPYAPQQPGQPWGQQPQQPYMPQQHYGAQPDPRYGAPAGTPPYQQPVQQMQGAPAPLTQLTGGMKAAWAAVGLLGGVTGVILAWLINVNKAPQIKNEALKWCFVGLALNIVASIIYVWVIVSGMAGLAGTGASTSSTFVW